MRPRGRRATLRVIEIKDAAMGDEFALRTLRNPRENVGCLEESEKNEVVDRLQEPVSEACRK